MAPARKYFHTIKGVKTIGGPSGSATVIDASTLESTAKEKIMGLADEGQIALQMHYDPSDTDVQVAMQAKRTAREIANFEITFTDSPATIAAFAGYVTGFSISSAVDAIVEANSTIEITGPVTFSYRYYHG